MPHPFANRIPFADNLAPNKGIMKGLQSPLQDEFKDGDFSALSSLIDFVPFLDAGDATLRVVRDLRKLSPTQGGCISSKLDYCTAGGLGFMRKDDSVFKRQNNKEQVVSDAEHDTYASFLTEALDANNLLQKIREAGDNYLTYGNFVLEIVLTKTVGYAGAAINVYDAAMFRYRRENDKAVTSECYISPRWDLAYLSRNNNTANIKKYSVYPAFSEHEDGTFRSIMHIKNPALYQSWYGLPSSFPSIYFQFLEYQLGKYTTRGYENLWLPAAFVETYNMPYETDTEEAKKEAQELVQQMANIYTNRGDGLKLPIVFRQATEGTTPSTITQFSHNTDESFHLAMSETAEKQILKSHSWHRSLLEKTVGSIGNNSENADLAMITDKTVIRPLQEKILNPFRAAISIAEQWMGYKNSGIVIDLKSVFEAPIQQPAPFANSQNPTL